MQKMLRTLLRSLARAGYVMDKGPNPTKEQLKEFKEL